MKFTAILLAAVVGGATAKLRFHGMTRDEEPKGNLRSLGQTAAYYHEGHRIDPQDVYGNGDYANESREDCDDDKKFEVEVTIETGDEGENNAIYLVKEDMSSSSKPEFLFLLSAPAMSLQNDKKYPSSGKTYLCLDSDSKYRYHWDVSNVKNEAGYGDGKVELKVKYKGDSITWKNTGNWYYDYAWFEKDAQAIDNSKDSGDKWD